MSTKKYLTNVLLALIIVTNAQTMKGDAVRMTQVEISNRAIEICSMYDKLDKTAQDAIYMAGKLLLAQNETQRESNIRKMLEKA